MRIVDMGDKELQMMLQAAREMGRGGDSDIVHVNAAEKKMLKEAGGSGTVNPDTGLREYFTGGGGGRDSGANSPSGDKGRGVSGGDKGGSKSGGSGERGTPSQQQDRRNYEAARSRGNVAPGVKADDRNRSLGDNSPTDIARAFSNKAKAQKDFEGEDDDFLDKIGNFIAGAFGWNEVDPTTQDVESFTNFDTAQTQIDPIAAALGVASLAFPIASVARMGYGIAQQAGLEGPQISLGRSASSFEDAERAVSTASAGGRALASGRTAGQQNPDRRGGEFGEKGRTNGRTHTTGNPNVTKPATTPPAAETPKSPADILMERYKLPGINAPFSLTPYSIDRTRHNELVANALQGRGMGE